MVNIQLTGSFLVLSLVGLVNASYLFWKHYEKKLICPLNHDCSVVTESGWSHIFFIRNEILGVLFFATMLAGMLFALLVPAFTQTTLLLILLATIGGLLFSIFLILVQIFAIKDYCFYCIVSAIITLFLFLNSLLLYLS